MKPVPVPACAETMLVLSTWCPPRSHLAGSSRTATALALPSSSQAQEASELRHLSENACRERVGVGADCATQRPYGQQEPPCPLRAHAPSQAARAFNRAKYTATERQLQREADWCLVAETLAASCVTGSSQL
jgi:hypothetical protein